MIRKGQKNLNALAGRAYSTGPSVSRENNWGGEKYLLWIHYGERVAVGGENKKQRR